jgi:hypothetical protein
MSACWKHAVQPLVTASHARLCNTPHTIKHAQALWYPPPPTCSVRVSPGSRVRASGPMGVLPCTAQYAVNASAWG